jgi:hypothetical protein
MGNDETFIEIEKIDYPHIDEQYSWCEYPGSYFLKIVRKHKDYEDEIKYSAILFDGDLKNLIDMLTKVRNDNGNV